jgi:hypothetical protein
MESQDDGAYGRSCHDDGPAIGFRHGHITLQS